MAPLKTNKKVPPKLSKANTNSNTNKNDIVKVDLSETSDNESNTSDSESITSTNSSIPNKANTLPKVEEISLMSSQSVNIKFSIMHNKYSFLSSLYDCDLIVDGIRYRHVEGYYESARFQGVNDKAVTHLANIHSPKLCKRTAATYFLPLEIKNKWNDDKMYNTMKRINYIKFMTNTKLMKKLINTGESKLISMDLKDSYWGGGEDGKGQNKLGNMLMEIRDVCKKCDM